MTGIGIPALIPVLIIIAVVVFALTGGRLNRVGGGIRVPGPTLVLRKFEINEDRSTGILVDIIGRASGITAWLLTIIGLDTETNLQVTDQELSFKSSSLYGQIHQVVPLPSISSTNCGYSKPIGYLILGAIFLVGGVILGLGQRGGGPIILIGIIIGTIFLVAYCLSKKMVVSIETKGGIIVGISFKRSVIENVGIDIEQALKTIRIVNKKVIESQKNIKGGA